MKQPQPSASPTPHTIPDSAIGAFRTAYAVHDPKKGYADAIRAGLAAAAPLVSHEATLSMEPATMERIRAEISSLRSYSSGYYVRVDAVLALLDRHASNREPNSGGNRLTAPAQSFQGDVATWMGQCFPPSLYSNMTERGDRLLEEVLELLQAHGYDSARVPTLVNYVFGRPVGEPTQEVGGVMVTLAAYCSVAGLSMQADGQAELDRINQPEVMARIRAKQEAKNALHFDTPLPGDSAQPAAVGQEPVELACVAETLANGVGQWRTCTGCHESNEGWPTGPYSKVMQCHLGNGCDECGGIGAIWDTTDYQQMGDEMAESLAAPSAQAVDLGQFRPAVCVMGLYAEEPDDVDEAKRLLALIDSNGSAGEPNTAPNRLTYTAQANLFYIQDTRQFVGNCPMWWGPNGSGYVTRLDEAGRYTEQEAIRQNRTRETDVPWPCSEIDAIARQTVDCQHMRPRAERLAELALIDSRAVGNG